METRLPEHPEGRRDLPPPERPTKGGNAPAGPPPEGGRSGPTDGGAPGAPLDGAAGPHDGCAGPDDDGLHSTSAPERSPRRRIRRVTAGALLLAAAAAGGWWLLGRVRLDGPSGSNPRVVQVEMGMMGFEPSSIRVRAGDTVTLRLHTPESPFQLDGPIHQLAVDELGVDLQVGGGETAEATITPTEPGTYVFYCDLCCSGRANPSMRGELVVSG